jgi:hypothetical protein
MSGLIHISCSNKGLSTAFFLRIIFHDLQVYDFVTMVYDHN